MSNLTTFVKNLIVRRYIPYLPPNGQFVEHNETVSVQGDLSTILKLSSIPMFDTLESEELGGLVSVAISLGGRMLTDLATPVNSTDAATKGYVDDHGGGGGGSVIVIASNTLAVIGKTYSNETASMDIVLQLPVATVNAEIDVVIKSANYLKLQANAGDMLIYGSAGTSVSGGYIRSNELDATLSLRCYKAGSWNVANQPMGLWTIDE